MGAPRVVDDRLVFTLDDPDHARGLVQLVVDDELVDDHRFRRTAGGWTLSIRRPPVHRIEYRLLLVDADGDTRVVLDPANPATVATAFGHRSVAHLPEYREPAWCTAATVPGARAQVVVDTSVGAVPVTTWAPTDLPDGTAAPLLVVHDGPEYDRLADLGRWAGAAVAADRVRRFRMALLQPVERDHWYAANPDWPTAVATVVAEVDRHVARRGRLVTMGASLGGLAALQVARSGQVAVGGVFSQSGSFFQRDLDPQEADYPYFGRITSWVAAVAANAAGDRADALGAAPDRTGHGLDVALTCGRNEENHANNVAMADLLRAAGNRVTLRSLPDLHNYTAWRDGLEPALGDLLARQWGGPTTPATGPDHDAPARSPAATGDPR